MKTWVMLALTIGALGVEAGTLKAVFKNESAPRELRYLAVFDPTEGSQEYVVAFGEGLAYKVYPAGELASFEGSQNSTTDLTESTSLVAKTLVRQTTTQVKITRASDNRTLVNGVYRKHDSITSSNFAKNVDRVVEAEFNRYRQSQSAATIAEARRIFRQVDMDFGYDWRDSSQEFPFPTYDLQIEFSLSLTAADSKLARATITRSGSDEISRKFLTAGSQWFGSLGEAESNLIEKLESNSETEELTFASFGSRVTYEGLSERLKRVIAPHLKAEVLSVNGFDCEDSIYTWVSATWILKDGSTLGYHPGTECD